MRHLVEISVLDINFYPYIANNNKLHLAPFDMLLLKRDMTWDVVLVLNNVRSI